MVLAMIKLFADLHPVRDVPLGRKEIVSKSRIPLGMYLSVEKRLCRNVASR